MKFLMNSLFIFAMMALVVSCKNDAGTKAETGEAEVAAEATGKSYSVDPASSIIMWEGSKIAGTHTGTLNLSEGNISVENGKVTGGNFVIDMNSLNVTDLDGDQKTYLESHLKGSTDENANDFFNVANYPSSKFEITKITDLGNDTLATNLVYGNLTLKDSTKLVGFRANIQITDAGVFVETPKFTIDRTEWGLKYGSGKFFDDLKDKAINDNMSISIKLRAN